MPQIYMALAVTIGCFGCYPLIVRSAGTVGIVCPFVLVMASLVPIGLVAGYFSPSISLSANAWLRLGIAGFIMGVGFMGFTFLLGQPRLEASRIIPIISISTLLVAVGGGWWFFSEAFTLQKAIGVIAALVAIILLRPQG